MNDEMFVSGAGGGVSAAGAGLANLVTSKFFPKQAKARVTWALEFTKATRISPQQLAAVMLRVFGAFYTYSIVLNYQLPPFVHAFYVYAVAALFYLAQGARQAVWTKALRKNLLLVCVHAGWHLVNFVLWTTALLMLHPLQAVLAEYTEFLFLAVFTEYLNRSAGSNYLRRRGVVIKFVVSLLFLALAHGRYEVPAGHTGSRATFHPQSNTYGGMALIVLYSLSEVCRKSYKGWLGRSVGTASVTVASSIVSVPLLFPFVALYSGFAPHTWSVVQSLPHCLALAANAALLIILPSMFLGSYGVGGGGTGQAADSSASPSGGGGGGGGGGSGASQSTPSKVQCGCSMIFAFVLHFVMAYKPDSAAGIGVVYSLVLGAATVCMVYALDASHTMITRSSQPYIVDPFAEYELPDVEVLEGGVLHTIMRDSTSKKLLVFLLMNLFYTAIEFLYGAFSGSLGLVSDSFHMLLDSLSVAIALVAAYVATWPANREHPYGYGRYEVMSGFTNGVVLVCISAYICMEAVTRLVFPTDVDGDWLLSVSIGGLAINVIGVLFFHEAHHVGPGSSCSHSHAPSPSSSHDGGAAAPSSCGGGHGHGHAHSHSHSHSHGASPTELHSDPASPTSSASASGGGGGGSGGATQAMNMRGVYLHILADLLGSVGVILSSLVVKMTGWSYADPICSLCISGLILMSAWPLLRETGTLLLQSLQPEQQRALTQCAAAAQDLPGVYGVTTKAWQHTPGSPMGMVYVSAAAEVDELRLLGSLRAAFVPFAPPYNLTFEIQKR